MWMHGFGGFGGWWLFGMLFWVAVIVGVVALVVWAVRSAGRGASAAAPGGDALAVLKLRYARGEITREQFEQMRKDIDR